MHRTRFVLGFTALFLTMGIVVTADQGRGGAKPQHPTASPHTTSTMKPAAAMQPKGMKPLDPQNDEAGLHAEDDEAGFDAEADEGGARAKDDQNIDRFDDEGG